MTHKSKLDAIIYAKGAPNSAPNHRIKDYARVNSIFRLYLENKFDTMSREIYFYKDFDFFVDLLTYLADEFKSDLHRHFYYMDVVDQYLARLEMVWAEMKLRKERRKYAHIF